MLVIGAIVLGVILLYMAFAFFILSFFDEVNPALWIPTAIFTLGGGYLIVWAIIQIVTLT